MRWPKSLSVSRWTRGRPRKCRNAEGGRAIERVVLSYVRQEKKVVVAVVLSGEMLEDGSVQRGSGPNRAKAARE